MRVLALSVLALLLLSYGYLFYGDDLILIPIFAISLASVKSLGINAKRASSALFVLFFFISSALLFLGFPFGFQTFGVLSFVFFASMAAAATMEYLSGWENG